MRKEHLRLLEAVDKFNGILDARLRFFIGAAIRDALALGRRSELLTEPEAQALLDIVEAEIMTEARDDERVKMFIAANQRSALTEAGEDEKQPCDADECNISPREYYDIFIRPALDIIREEYSELIGSIFVKYICTGERPSEDALTEDEKLLWNVFMAMVEIKFNADFSEFITDVNEGE